MKVTVIANISANGKILLSDNPHHQLPPEAMGFYLEYAKQVGNLVIGLKTFENFQNFPQEVKELFKDIEIIILSDIPYISDDYKTVRSPEEAIEYTSARGLDEIAVGGGTGTFNAFIAVCSYLLGKPGRGQLAFQLINGSIVSQTIRLFKGRLPRQHGAQCRAARKADIRPDDYA